MTARRKAREYALQRLFQIHVLGTAEDSAERFWSDRQASPATREFADRLVVGVLAHREEIDAVIRKYAEHWSLERIGLIERNILRFAIYELLFLAEIPPKVTINEAIEIAKKYGDRESSAFVNGILDRIMEQELGFDPNKQVIQRGDDAGHGPD